MFVFTTADEELRGASYSDTIWGGNYKRCFGLVPGHGATVGSQAFRCRRQGSRARTCWCSCTVWVATAPLRSLSFFHLSFSTTSHRGSRKAFLTLSVHGNAPKRARVHLEVVLNDFLTLGHIRMHTHRRQVVSAAGN